MIFFSSAEDILKNVGNQTVLVPIDLVTNILQMIFFNVLQRTEGHTGLE